MKKISVILTVLLVAACSCKSSEKSAAASRNLPLVKTVWTLTHINGMPVAEMPTAASIVFKEDGAVGGSLGCNSFFGSYYIKKDKIFIEFTGATKKLCSEMGVENQYLSAIKSEITHYVISGNVLILKNKSREILRFKATEQS